MGKGEISMDLVCGVEACNLGGWGEKSEENQRK